MILSNTVLAHPQLTVHIWRHLVHELISFLSHQLITNFISSNPRLHSVQLRDKANSGPAPQTFQESYRGLSHKPCPYYYHIRTVTL